MPLLSNQITCAYQLKSVYIPNRRSYRLRTLHLSLLTSYTKKIQSNSLCFQGFVLDYYASNENRLGMKTERAMPVSSQQSSPFSAHSS